MIAANLAGNEVIIKNEDLDEDPYLSKRKDRVITLRMDENLFNIVKSYAIGKAPTLDDNTKALFYPCTLIREKYGLGGLLVI